MNLSDAMHCTCIKKHSKITKVKSDLIAVTSRQNGSSGFYGLHQSIFYYCQGILRQSHAISADDDFNIIFFFTYPSMISFFGKLFVVVLVTWRTRSQGSSVKNATSDIFAMGIGSICLRWVMKREGGFSRLRLARVSKNIGASIYQGLEQTHQFTEYSYVELGTSSRTQNVIAKKLEILKIFH